MPWKSDSDVSSCFGCERRFILTRRRHHCRLCGDVMCNKCSHFMSTEFASQFKATQPVRKINFLGRNLYFSRKIDKSWFQLFGARLPPVGQQHKFELDAWNRRWPSHSNLYQLSQLVGEARPVGRTALKQTTHCSALRGMPCSMLCSSETASKNYHWNYY